MSESDPLKKKAKATHRAHVFYSGRVQGIGFRHEVESVAHRAGLLGWVKNLHDGRVEMVCEGSKTVIDTLLTEMQEGPLGRFIKKVDCAWETPTQEFGEFRVEFCY